MYDTLRVSAAISQLTATFHHFEDGDNETALAVYYRVISTFDTEDIEAVVEEFVHGRVSGQSLKYLPTAAEFAATVRGRRDKRLQDAQTTRSILDQIEAREQSKEGSSETRMAAVQRIMAGSTQFIPEREANDPIEMLRKKTEAAAALAKHDAFWGIDRTPENTAQRFEEYRKLRAGNGDGK